MTCFNINRFHVFVMIFWQFSKFVAAQMLFPIFGNYVPKWRCSATEEFAKNCTIMAECQTGIEYQDSYFMSSAQEFNWICGSNAYYTSFYTQLQFCGVIVGTVISGSVADAFGRRPVCIVVLVLCTISFVFSGLAPNWQLLLASRFCIGVSIGGSISIVTLCMELILPNQRIPMRGLFNWGTARLGLTAICYFLPEWRKATLAFVPISIIQLLIMVFVIPESPTWLHSKGQMNKMHKVEEKIAKFAHVEYKKSEVEQISGHNSFLDLIHNKVLFKRLTILWFMFFVSSVCSYGNDFNSSSISGNLFLNQALFSIFIGVSKLVLIFVDSNCPNFSRRNLHQGAQLVVILCFLCLIALVVLWDKSIFILIINLIGTMFIEFTWDGCYLSATESMPTQLRASAVASCSLSARLGGLIAPMLSHVNQFWAFGSYFVITVLGVVNLLTSYLWLVETKGVSLDEVRLDDSKLEEEMKLKATPEAIELMEEHKNDVNEKV